MPQQNSHCWRCKYATRPLTLAAEAAPAWTMNGAPLSGSQKPGRPSLFRDDNLIGLRVRQSSASSSGAATIGASRRGAAVFLRHGRVDGWIRVQPPVQPAGRSQLRMLVGQLVPRPSQGSTPCWVMCQIEGCQSCEPPPAPLRPPPTQSPYVLHGLVTQTLTRGAVLADRH